MTKSNKMLLAAGILFAMACVVESSMKPLPGAGQIASKGSSIYAMAGEFRTVAANLLWIKADAYHHEFIAKNGDWTANKELIGMFRMIVDLDPHFEEAYASGMYIYIRGYKSPKSALIFLKEGISNNPNSWDLNRLAALLYAIEYRDYSTALVYAKKSFAYCNDPFNKKIIAKLILTLQEKTGGNKRLTPQSHSG